MKHKLVVVPDSDPTWTPSMELWWNQGGALLWNQFGGFGQEAIVLTDEQLGLFMERALKIEGWEDAPRTWPGQDPPAAKATPVIIRPPLEEEITEFHEPGPDGPASQCCQDCGRPLHPALSAMHDREWVPVPTKELNHLLNSLQEAVEFSRGKGPNNARTWEAALEEGIAAIKHQL